MLARVNRVVTADDYRATVRNGRKTVSAHAAVYIRSRLESSHPRFGFIVAKTVGNAVQRNLVRRRLKNVCFESLAATPRGCDVVIRMLPGSAQISWANLNQEITVLLTRGMAKL